MGCSRTTVDLYLFDGGSNNTNKWDAQEHIADQYVSTFRSNNTNKWDAQEREKALNHR